MSFKATPAFSSRIKKPKKAPAFKRSSSGLNPYSSLSRRKPIQRSATKPESTEHEEEDFFNDRLDDVGLVQSLATDLILRDVPQAMLYIRGKMWTPLPEQRTGMNSARIAEVLNFRVSQSPIVTATHIQALLDSPTVVEKEIAELTRGGAIRKIVVNGRGRMGEVLILVKDMETMIESSNMDSELKKKFIILLRGNTTSLKLPPGFAANEVKELMKAGFITFSNPNWTVTDAVSRPGHGSRGTLTSIDSISRAASGSMAAVGGEGAVHAAGGSGGGAKSSNTQEYDLALPGTGPFLKLLANSRTHLLSLLSKSKYREAPESLLRQRWDGGIAIENDTTAAKRNRGEFAGVLPGRTRKWKQFNGISFEWILGECVGAGLVEVFNTGSVGRGIRAL
ncbi:hypothetical protein HYFRA_00007913 [Hymenoscyphus fraxineus]|uniref:Serine-threonine protein kinase 19 n=1 Tax=Hymenoscyphus fraxineus TaxID=746836 RepID=A0A9N9KSD8_9HELO|nr:hypothetical protein HYFRA_00007913 [Hymenoscyphus fraxineus]